MAKCLKIGLPASILICNGQKGVRGSLSKTLRSFCGNSYLSPVKGTKLPAFVLDEHGCKEMLTGCKVSDSKPGTNRVSVHGLGVSVSVDSLQVQLGPCRDVQRCAKSCLLQDFRWLCMWSVNIHHDASTDVHIRAHTHTNTRITPSHTDYMY